MVEFKYPDIERAAEGLPFVQVVIKEIDSSLEVKLADQPDPYSRLAYDVLDVNVNRIAKLALLAERSLGWATTGGQISLRKEIVEQLRNFKQTT